MENIREDVINEIIASMCPLMDSKQLQILEGNVRSALHGVKLEKECTELSTQFDSTMRMLDYFEACKKLDGCKKNTLEQYRRTAKRLFDLVGKGFREITKDDVRYYLAIRAPQVGSNTLVNERRNLSSFFG